MHSFDVVAAISPDTSTPGHGPRDDFPTEQRFTLRLETVPDGLRGIAGRAGNVAEILLTGRGDGTYVFDDPSYSGVGLPIDLPRGDCIGVYGSYDVRYEHIELRLEQRGTPPVIRVVGLASGAVNSNGAVEGFFSPFVATFEGSLDTTPPSYRTNVHAEEHHVLDGLVISASEPLPRSTAVMLDGVGALVPEAGDGSSAVARFSTPPAAVLPWSSPLSLTFAPSLTDLAGNAASAPSEALPRTIADPGMMSTDGFESELHAWSSGDVRVVAPGDGGPEPITGDGSLYVGRGDSTGRGGGRFTARIPVPAGATRLRARFRTLGWFGVFGFGFLVYAPNVGAVERVQLPIPASGGAPFPTQSEVVELDVPLPDGSEGEILIDIDNRMRCGPPLPQAALLIDDLRAE